jgi:hypothetical protein
LVSKFSEQHARAEVAASGVFTGHDRRVESSATKLETRKRFRLSSWGRKRERKRRDLAKLAMRARAKRAVARGKGQHDEDDGHEMEQFGSE